MYSVHVPTVTDSSMVTNLSGGYIRVGNIVVVNISITTTQTISGSTNIRGFPAPIQDNSPLYIMRFDSSLDYDNKYTARIYGINGWMAIGSYVPAGTYRISGSYIAS